MTTVGHVIIVIYYDLTRRHESDRTACNVQHHGTRIVVGRAQLTTTTGNRAHQ